MPLVRRRDPFDDPKYVYELKLDGFRALAHVERGECKLVADALRAGDRALRPSAAPQARPGDGRGSGRRGFLALFDGPARGVRCGLTIRDGVRPLGLEVRAGLHTGECVRMGDNVGGIAVHIGARIAAEASAGEVITSSTVKDLVVGSGLTFQDRGHRALKGVEGEWRLFAAG
jgi:hypothetical protein